MEKLLRRGFCSLPLILFLLHARAPRTARASAPTAPPAESQPSNVAVYKIPERPLASLAPAPASLRRDRPTAQEVKEVKAYIRSQALESGVDPQLALWIAKHESSFNPRAQGDGDASRGLWQISRIYHPEVSDDAAFGVKSSTDWSMQLLRNGKANEWSAYRYCRALYDDCPF